MNTRATELNASLMRADCHRCVVVESRDGGNRIRLRVSRNADRGAASARLDGDLRSLVHGGGEGPGGPRHLPTRVTECRLRFRRALSGALYLGQSNREAPSHQRDGTHVSRRATRAVDFGVTRHRATASAIRLAAVSGSSCSQTRTTVQPASTSRRLVSASRALVFPSLTRHHSAFARGWPPCSGQSCQKHPSTNMATRAAEKTTSALRRRSGIGLVSTRYRSPRR